MTEYNRILARAFGALISGDRKEVESFPPLNTPEGRAERRCNAEKGARIAGLAMRPLFGLEARTDL